MWSQRVVRTPKSHSWVFEGPGTPVQCPSVRDTFPECPRAPSWTPARVWVSREGGGEGQAPRAEGEGGAAPDRPDVQPGCGTNRTAVARCSPATPNCHSSSPGIGVQAWDSSPDEGHTLNE